MDIPLTIQTKEEANIWSVKQFGIGVKEAIPKGGVFGKILSGKPLFSAFVFSNLGDLSSEMIPGISEILVLENRVQMQIFCFCQDTQS